MIAVRGHVDRQPHRSRAITVHEMAHAALTRFGMLRPYHDLCQAEVELLRTLEEGRIERWMVRRFPGSSPWIAELRDRPAPPLDARAPRMMIFTTAVLFEAVREDLSREAGEDAEVRCALDATRDARRRYLAAVPPVDAAAAAALGRSEDVVARYRRCVAPYLVGARASCDPIERATRLAAFDALMVALHEVLPAARALLEADVFDLAALLQARPGRRERLRTAWQEADIPLLQDALARLRGAAGAEGFVPSRGEVEVARDFLERGDLAHAEYEPEALLFEETGRRGPRFPARKRPRSCLSVEDPGGIEDTER